MTKQTTTHRPTILIRDDRREQFLPTLFGQRLPIVAENTVYTMMERLSPSDYHGGFWNFYERDSEPLYLAPTSRPHFRIESDLTEFRGEVSADAAGIAATLFALSHLSVQFESELMQQRFYRLRIYSFHDPEVTKILPVSD